MKLKILSLLLFVCIVTGGWFVWTMQTENTVPAVTEKVDNMDTFTATQQKEIKAHSDKMQALTNVRPVPSVNIPPSVRPMTLPDIKQLDSGSGADNLTENGLGTDSTNTMIDSTELTTGNTSSPVIESVSRQTGIPASDIERAFNQ